MFDLIILVNLYLYMHALLFYDQHFSAYEFVVYAGIYRACTWDSKCKICFVSLFVCVPISQNY